MNALLFDFSRVLLFPKDSAYTGSLNELHRLHKDEKEYRIFDLFIMNNELVEYLQTIKNDVQLSIFTSETIQDSPEFKEYLSNFEKIYSGIKLGLSKKDPYAYEVIANDIGKQPNEILFIDDSLENINAAKKVGLKTILFTSTPKLIQMLQELSH